MVDILTRRRFLQALAASVVAAGAALPVGVRAGSKLTTPKIRHLSANWPDVLYERFAVPHKEWRLAVWSAKEFS